MSREKNKRKRAKGARDTYSRPISELAVEKSHLNFSLSPDSTYEDLIQGIAKRLNWRVEGLPERLRGISFPRGRPVFGSAGEVLDRIAGAHGLHWIAKDGVLRFRAGRRKPTATEVTPEERSGIDPGAREVRQARLATGGGLIREDLVRRQPLGGFVGLSDHEREQLARLRPNLGAIRTRSDMQLLEELADAFSRQTERKRSNPGGRPRKDKERERAREMRAANMPWKDIRKALDKEFNQEKSVDAYRSLLKPNKTAPKKNGQK